MVSIPLTPPRVTYPADCLGDELVEDYRASAGNSGYGELVGLMVVPVESVKSAQLPPACLKNRGQQAAEFPACSRQLKTSLVKIASPLV